MKKMSGILFGLLTLCGCLEKTELKLDSSQTAMSSTEHLSDQTPVIDPKANSSQFDPKNPDHVCQEVFGGKVNKNSCQIRKSVHLKKISAKMITYTIQINIPNIEIDCNGNSFSPPTDQLKKNTHYTGFTIKGSSKTPADNVTVKNCIISGFGVAAQVSSPVPKDIRKKALKSKNFDKAYHYSPKNVVLDNLTITNNKRKAIGFGPFVTGATLQNSKITDSDEMGVYFSTYSKKNYVKNTLFRNLGKKRKREAMSIDASPENIILDNIFEQNPYGGIAIYKNCQEHAQKIDPNYQPNSVVRHLRPNDNRIEGNQFRGHPIAIHLASRQSEFLGWIFCGDKSPYPFPYNLGYWLDYSKRNLIKNNIFEKNKLAIRVEDDENKIVENTFLKNGVDVIVGAKKRNSFLKRPVSRTQLIDNKFSKPSGTVQLIYGTRDTFITAKDCPNKLKKKSHNNGIIQCHPKEIATSEMVNQVDEDIIYKITCRNSSNNIGCRHTFYCPTDYKLKKARMGCNLEMPKITALPSWGKMQIFRKSDIKKNGRCRFGDTKSTTSTVKLTPSGTSVTLECKEHDKNGGDCSFHAEIMCTPR